VYSPHPVGNTAVKDPWVTPLLKTRGLQEVKDPWVIGVKDPWVTGG